MKASMLIRLLNMNANRRYGSLLPTGCLVGVGIVVGMHENSPVWLWVPAAVMLLIFGYNRIGDMVKKGIGETGPSLERCKEFLGVIGTLTEEELTDLYTLVKGTEVLTTSPASMAIDNAGRLTSLTRKNRKLFPTDGHALIWIAEPYRPFASEWAKGRSC